LYPEFVTTLEREPENAQVPSSMEEYQFSWDCDGMVYRVYGYHPTYMGSVELVSMLSGHVHPFFMYTPWGESMYEYSAQTTLWTFDSPFRFNDNRGGSTASDEGCARSAELDKETGYGYYGARYYQSKLSMWLSVDPLAHKMPAMSPYVFTANNPILFHDPTGLIPVVPEPPNENDPEPPLGPGMIPTENHPGYGIYWPQGSGRVSESTVSLASKGLPSLGGSSETSVNGSMAAGQGVNPGLALANAINSMPLVMLTPVPMINPLFGAGAVAIDGGANLVGAEGDLGIF
jgi:RHS repeat-associated protein